MKYFLSIFYVLFLYIFWVGFVSGVLLELKPPSGAIGFSSGLIFGYIIANNASKKGYSWWKNFLIYEFLSTGVPLIGIIKLIKMRNMPQNNEAIKNNSNNIFKNIISNKTEELKTIEYKNVLKNNNLENYIEIFEKNKLNDIELIMTLTENDYEKIGINILGDIKRLLIIFSKNELIKNINNYKEKVNKINTDTVFDQDECYYAKYDIDILESPKIGSLIIIKINANEKINLIKKGEKISGFYIDDCWVNISCENGSVGWCYFNDIIKK